MKEEYLEQTKNLHVKYLLEEREGGEGVKMVKIKEY
jgi:hypothetical protein